MFGKKQYASIIGIPATQATIMADIFDERDRQDAKWGTQNHPDGTGTLYQIRQSVAARAVCNEAASRGQVTWNVILNEEVKEAFAESDPVKLRTELIQVAAVAMSWIEAIDRRSNESN